MRLFIAIALPREVRDDLARLQRGLRSARWIAPENFHLTLAFLGELEGTEAADVDAALSSLRLPSFTLRLEGVGVFGEGRKLRALWAGVAQNEALCRLQAKVVRAVESAGQPPAARKFKPHVTLARFKGASDHDIGRYLEENGLFRTADFPVEEVLLFSSFRAGNGPIYRAEAHYPLLHHAGEPLQSQAR